MFKKSIIFSILLLAGFFTKAQISANDKAIKDIEHSIKFNRFNDAHNKIVDLLPQVNKSGENEIKRKFFLNLKYLEALTLDRQDTEPQKPLLILLKIKDDAEKEEMHGLSFKISLLIALCYEKSQNLKLTDRYLTISHQLYKKYHLDRLYSTYCIRRGSYLRYKNNVDSTFYFAKEAEKYALRFGNEEDLADSKILFNFVSNRKKNYADVIKRSFELVEKRKKFSDSISIFVTYDNIAQDYLKLGNTKAALQYNDSCRIYFGNKPNIYNDYVFYKTRYEIFEILKNSDSAYYYFKKYHFSWIKNLENNSHLETAKIEQQYQFNNKESIIKNKTRQLSLSILLIAAISIAVVLIIFRNKKIKRQNKIINSQLTDLSKVLQQKQVLLSELQHRVKNNLQHVISILEIQKESVNFNNIDELIRGNQNRIHSIALVHKKLNVTDNVNEVALPQYIKELSELVKDSYENQKRAVSLNVNCETQTLPIEKALPLGLIIVELLSNSMKHAFHKRKFGIINLHISVEQFQNKLYYSDNGSGFNFEECTEKGLGQEIIKGLIDQLDAEAEAHNHNGFELTLYFK